MNRKRRTARMAAALAAALLLSVTISAAAEPGSAKDPLVTLSYLNDTYLNTIMEKVDARIRQRNADLLGQLGQSGGTSSGSSSSANFVLVTLSSGQTLTGSVGCEVLRDHRHHPVRRQRTGPEPPVHDDGGEPGRPGRDCHGEAAGPGRVHCQLRAGNRHKR